MYNLNNIKKIRKLKKMIFGGLYLALVGIGFIGCEKDHLPTTVQNEDAKIFHNDNQLKVADGGWWEIFDEIRIHRATTERKRDGKNCGCNECFGLCNAPHGKGIIAVNNIDGKTATIAIINTSGINDFDKEFGVDEPIELNNGHYEVTIRKGVYTAERKDGVIKTENGNEYNYYAIVHVQIEDYKKL